MQDAELKIRRLVKLIDQLRARQVLMHELLVSNGLVSDYPELQPVVKNIKGHSGKMVLAFGGMNHTLSLPPAEFLKTLRATDSSTIFFKDFNQCWYQRGLLGLTKNVSETIAYIDDLVRSFNGKDIITLGASSGGFAAILFGVAINAKTVISFSPQTFIDRDVYRNFKSPDTKMEDALRDKSDLKKVLADYPGSGSKIIIFFDANNDRDKKHAMHISSDSRVVLRPFQGTGGHNSANQLKDSGLLEKTIREIILS